MTRVEDDIAKTLGLGAKRKTLWTWAKYAVALAVIITGGWYWMSFSGAGKAAEYETATAEIRDIKVTVTATGTVEPTNLVEISSELSGTLKTVKVDFNDQVSQGSILAELDTTKLEALLAVSKASLDSAIARVALAQATLEEAREKYESGLRLEERGITSHQAFVSQKASYVRAQSELQSAIANRALAEAEVDLHQAELDKACICSPIDGIVLDRAVDPGQIVAAALTAPVLFSVAEDLTKMELQVDVDEADIGRTAVGNKAIFTVDAYDERTFPAEISEIRFAPKTIDGVVTYKAVLTIDNTDMLLRPGMTATADVTVAEIEDALSVPNAALRYAPPPEAAAKDEDRSGLLGMLIPQGDGPNIQGDNRTLWVLRDGVATEIGIKTGATDGSHTQIIEGDLQDGDVVITNRIDD